MRSRNAIGEKRNSANLESPAYRANRIRITASRFAYNDVSVVSIERYATVYVRSEVAAITMNGIMNSAVSENNGNRHRASVSEVSKVKNARSDASVHGFVIAYLEYRTAVLDGTNRLQSLLCGSTANSPGHQQYCQDTRIVEQAQR